MAEIAAAADPAAQQETSRRQQYSTTSEEEDCNGRKRAADEGSDVVAPKVKKSRVNWSKEPRFAVAVTDWLNQGPSKFDKNGEEIKSLNVYANLHDIPLYTLKNQHIQMWRSPNPISVFFKQKANMYVVKTSMQK